MKTGLVCLAWSWGLLLVPTLATADIVQGDVRSAAKSWLANPTLPLPAALESVEPLTKRQAKTTTQSLWKLYQSEDVAPREAKVLPQPIVIGQTGQVRLRPSDLKTGEKTMPFYFLQRGQTATLKPMFIALHGGGRAPVAGPHAWPINTLEWQTQTRLAATIYPNNALYFVPRMADDRDGRWYYDYCQDAYDRVVREAIRYHRVDPNRVYLIGISEGAYTAYRLGAFMADRWAGAGSMAGGEPLHHAPPANLRNLAFRADIGERDTMFDRVGLNRRYGEALAKLKQEDADGFAYMVKVHQGRGHGIDYRACPQWVFKFKRNPWPKRVRWINIDVHGRRRLQSYWLALDAAPERRLELDARVDRKTNTVSVDVTRREGNDARLVPDDTVSFRVYLNDALLDLDRPVRVLRNGQEVANALIPRRLSTMLRTLAERGDPNYCFPAVIEVARR